MTNGYENEVQFIECLDNKKYEELNPLMQDLIKCLYPTIKSKDIIYATKYGRYAKTDIVVSVRNKKRGISLKSGYKNSVHIEPIDVFKKFLLKNNISKEVIESLYYCIYSDGTTNNTGAKRVSNAEYIDKHPREIQKLNEVLNLLRQKLIKRFLIETDTKYKVQPAIFVHGNINDFIWATSEEVTDFLENEVISSKSLHSSKLYIQCWNKNLKKNPKYEYCRNYIQIKWFSMYDDIIAIMSRRQ